MEKKKNNFAAGKMFGVRHITYSLLHSFLCHQTQKKKKIVFQPFYIWSRARKTGMPNLSTDLVSFCKISSAAVLNLCVVQRPFVVCKELSSDLPKEILLKVDCLPNAVGKQPSIPLIYLGRKWTLNWWWWWWWWWTWFWPSIHPITFIIIWMVVNMLRTGLLVNDLDHTQVQLFFFAECLVWCCMDVCVYRSAVEKCLNSTQISSATTTRKPTTVPSMNAKMTT